MAHDTRDEIIDFINRWVERAEVAAQRLIKWIGLSPSKYFHWRTRYGKANEHNGWIPRDHWLERWEKQAIVKYATEHPLDGYRRLTFMMLDQEVVAVSPSSVYRVMKQAGLIGNRNVVPSRKGTGFVQPVARHEHWPDRYLVYQHPRHILLPLRGPGRMQPVYRALGVEGADDRA